LVDIVSKNGNLLLSIGPRADGTIPDEVRTILLDMGRVARSQRRGYLWDRAVDRFRRGPTQVKTGFATDQEMKPYTSSDFRFTRKGEKPLRHQPGVPRGRNCYRSCSWLGRRSEGQGDPGRGSARFKPEVDWLQTPMH